MKLSPNQREREFTVFVFVLILTVQWPKLSDASVCQLSTAARIGKRVRCFSNYKVALLELIAQNISKRSKTWK